MTNLMKAINMASLEHKNEDELLVKIKDLLELKRQIEHLEAENTKLNYKVFIAEKARDKAVANALAVRRKQTKALDEYA